MRKKTASDEVLREIAELGAKYSDTFSRQTFHRPEESGGEEFEAWIDEDRVGYVESNYEAILSDEAWSELMAQRAEHKGEMRKKKMHKDRQKSKDGGKSNASGGKQESTSAEAVMNEDESSDWQNWWEDTGDTFAEVTDDFMGEGDDIAEATAAAAASEASADIATAEASAESSRNYAIAGAVVLLGLIFVAMKK